MMRRSAILTIALLAGCAGAPHPQEASKKPFQPSNPRLVTPFESHYRYRAEGGEPQAMVDLAHVIARPSTPFIPAYPEGFQVTPERRRELLTWLRRAARSGHADAQLWLGLYLLRGFAGEGQCFRGVVQGTGWSPSEWDAQVTQATRWLRRASRSAGGPNLMPRRCQLLIGALGEDRRLITRTWVRAVQQVGDLAQRPVPFVDHRGQAFLHTDPRARAALRHLPPPPVPTDWPRAEDPGDGRLPQAQELLRQGRLEAGVRLAVAAVEAEPRDPRALGTLAVALLRTAIDPETGGVRPDRVIAAKSCLYRALQKSNDAQLHLALGIADAWHGLLTGSEEAISHADCEMEIAAHLDPKLKPLLKRLDRARAAAKLSLRPLPQQPGGWRKPSPKSYVARWHRRRGLEAHRKDRLDEAEACYTTSLTLATGSEYGIRHETHGLRALVRRSMVDLRGFEVDKAGLNLGARVRAKWARGDLGGARRQLDLEIDRLARRGHLARYTAGYMGLRGLVRALQGERAGAFEDLERAAIHFPERSLWLAALGADPRRHWRTLLKTVALRRDVDGAIARFHLGTRTDAQTLKGATTPLARCRVRCHLGLARERGGDLEGAARHYRRCLDSQNPEVVDSEAYGWALARLGEFAGPPEVGLLR
jgi:hypothetical protein